MRNWDDLQGPSNQSAQEMGGIHCERACPPRRSRSRPQATALICGQRSCSARPRSSYQAAGANRPVARQS